MIKGQMIVNLRSNFALVSLILFLFILTACGSDSEDNEGASPTSFDRKAMLSNWADNIIIPSYQLLRNDVNKLKASADAFELDVNLSNLQILRSAWRKAYISWQKVSLFLTGPSEDVFLRNFLNTYPTSAQNITKSILSGNYNLTGATSFDEQGFPALDYLLFGVASTDEAIVEIYTNQKASANYLRYLTDVVERIHLLTGGVTTAWEGEYRDIFVNNDGASATSATNRLVNDFINYYERNLRAGKIGIPAGVFSGGNPEPQTVEAFYESDLSKTLFIEALNTTQNFFNGISFDGVDGIGLDDYLNYLNTIKNGEVLSDLINNQFDASRVSASKLDDNLHLQLNTSNKMMLSTYNELQANVIFLKSDMTSALNISIDFADSDGD